MTIVQIGCHNGKDHVNEFVLKNKERIDWVYLIDANEDNRDAAIESYAGIPKTFLNYALTASEAMTARLFLPANGTCTDHASLLEDHLHNHNHKVLKEVIVPAININDLLELFDDNPIDRLYSDIEGMDVPVILSLDLARWKIPYIRFEVLHAGGSHVRDSDALQRLLERLDEHGYAVSEEGFDMIAQKFKPPTAKKRGDTK
jgi:hypothetical protein